MRTLIDIPEEELGRLTTLSKARHVSRSHLVRIAIEQYLRDNTADPIDQAFGLWGDDGEDGLAYQERMRSEW